MKKRLFLLPFLLLPFITKADAGHGICFTSIGNVSYATGSIPAGLTVADFDKDGKMDIAVANSSSNTVSVLPGNGDGTYNTRINSYTGSMPYSIVSGDFNKDGKQDVIVTNINDQNLSFSAGQGDNTFDNPVSITANGDVALVASGDFNGDGKLDLAVTSSVKNTVSILIGRGNGTFVAPRTYTAGVGTWGIKVYDINGDGKLDIITANNTSRDISVLIGNGKGLFAAAVNYPAGGQPNSVSITDLNGDAKPDVIVANQTKDSVTVLLANGAGTFSSPVSYKAGGLNADIADLVDYNADGKMDVLVNNSVGLCVMLSKGDGTLAPAITITNANMIVSYFIVADVNGDAKNDILISDSDKDDVKALVCGSDGLFNINIITSSYTVTPFPKAVTSADFNGDGKIDIASADYSGNNISVLLNDGSGIFKPAVSYPCKGNGPSAIINVDLNSDGIKDLVVTNLISNTISVFKGKSDGTFEIAVTSKTGTNPNSVASGDFNGDGKPDLAVANYNSTFISLLYGDGTGGFSSTKQLSAPYYPYQVLTNDVNNDGKTDIASVNYYNSITFYLSNGNGTFTTTELAQNASKMVMADFNNDGNTDLVTLGISSGVGSQRVVYSGNGDGTFTQLTSSSNTSGKSFESISSADFNLDGNMDIAIARDSIIIDVYQGNGAGDFTNQTYMSTNSAALGMTTNDFNGDGLPDLAYPLYSRQNVTVMFNSTAHIEASGDGTICKGDSVVLKSNHKFKSVIYDWSLSHSALQSITVKDDGTYSLTASTAGCQSYSNSFLVTVNPLPKKPAITAIDTILKSNSKVYNQWYFNGNIINGATDTTYTPTQNGVYTVKVMNIHGCEAESNPYNFQLLGVPGILEKGSVKLSPNPFDYTTQLNYTINNSAKVKICIVDVLGRPVVNTEEYYQQAGTHNYITQDDLPSGIYILQLNIDKESYRFKIIKK